MSDEKVSQSVHIYVDGEGKFDWMKHFKVRPGLITHLSALPRGMASGKASVAVVGKLKDGSYAFLEVSLRLMLGALAQWSAFYGPEADGNPQAALNEATKQRLQAALLLKLIGDREGQEVTYDIADVNAVMQSAQDIELAYGADGKTVTLRTKRSD